MRMYSLGNVALLVSFSLLAYNNLAYASSPCNFPAIFNLGDSNSDTGGFSAAFGQPPPPHGESYFHRPVGRYGDGRLIIDFITESLGFPYLSAYLDALAPNFSYGANFASVASTIRPPNTTLQQGGLSPFSLDVQFVQFRDFHSRSQFIRNQGGVFGGLLPKAEDFSRGLYTFDIGQNDITEGYFLNWTTDKIKASIPDILGQFKAIVQDVYEQGGRSFWIHNTGPVGCLPYVMEQQIDKVGCVTSMNEVAQDFNTKLKGVVVQLREELPLAALTYVDIYSVKYALISQAEKHGFMNPLQACCGYGGRYNFNYDVRCGGNITVNGEEVFVGSCKDPSVMINWDGVHYTQAANKWVFDQIVNGSFSDPPIPLSMACHWQ